MIMPAHIKESRDKLVREFESQGRTPQQCYADGWADALAHLQPENRRLRKLLSDIMAEFNQGQEK